MNLIVTCPRHFEHETKQEMEKILEDLGDESPEIILSGLSGILTIETKVNSLEIPHKIREKIKPFEFGDISSTNHRPANDGRTSVDAVGSTVIVLGNRIGIHVGGMTGR